MAEKPTNEALNALMDAFNHLDACIFDFIESVTPDDEAIDEQVGEFAYTPSGGKLGFGLNIVGSNYHLNGGTLDDGKLKIDIAKIELHDECESHWEFGKSKSEPWKDIIADSSGA